MSNMGDDTPETDALILETNREDVAGNANDFEHYFRLTGRLALKSRELERRLSAQARELNEALRQRNDEGRLRQGAEQRYAEIREQLGQAQAKLLKIETELLAQIDRATSLTAQRDGLEAKLAQSELDARRYRHLRENWTTSMPSVSVWWKLPGSWSAWSNEDLDKAIDEAIQKEPVIE